ERRAEYLMAAAFIVAVVLLALLEPGHRSFSAPLVVALTVAYAGASRIEFQVGGGYTVPTQLVFVPMLFAAPLAAVPVMLAAGLAAVGAPYPFLVALRLIGLLGVFARDRRAHIEIALELSRAYRGTALLLGDVVEADDAYTGSHSRDVVDLALEVADELGLD